MSIFKTKNIERKLKTIVINAIVIFALVGCEEKETVPVVKSDLEKTIETYKTYQTDFLIACAAGSNTSFMNNTKTPISIFYYKKDNVTDLQIFASSNANEKDYSKYSKIDLPNETLFNNRMGRFLSTPVNDKKWFVLTYFASNKFYISDPILIKSTANPTIDITNNITITKNGLTPKFNWETEPRTPNIIYFSLISNTNNDMISGTYTEIKEWSFYDLTKVVLNVTPTNNPTLIANNKYDYTLMGVDEENWVNTFGGKSFDTN